MRKYTDKYKQIAAEFRQWELDYPEDAKSKALRRAAFDRIADKHLKKSKAAA